MKTLSTITIFAAVFIIGCNVESQSQQKVLNLLEYWPSIAALPFLITAIYTLIVIRKSEEL